MRVAQHDLVALKSGEPTLTDKVAFLASPSSYSERVGFVICRETHMSWVFLTEDRVYKLKKPVRFPYLDFSTLPRREVACRAELALNRRLAPDVYLAVEPLTESGSGLSIGGQGEVVDWLVVMRWLDERWALDRMIEERRVKIPQLAGVVHRLGCFYRHARRAFVSAAAQRAQWRRNIHADCRVLLDDRFGLPRSVICGVMHAQLRFLDERAELLAARVAAGKIVDGHGDLRPEHIWLSDDVKIIDCLEFNARLRMVDPADELAYLSLECERLGARWVGDHIQRGVLHMLHDHPGDELLLFYRCLRASLRARLAIAHLLEPNPRTPMKWTPRALAYLEIARRDAERLNRLLSRREGR